MYKKLCSFRELVDLRQEYNITLLLRGSAGEYQADEQAGVARLHWQVSGRCAGRCRAAPLPSIRQMPKLVSHVFVPLNTLFLCPGYISLSFLPEDNFIYKYVLVIPKRIYSFQKTSYLNILFSRHYTRYQ